MAYVELDRTELTRLLSPLLDHVSFPIALSRARQGDTDARIALRNSVRTLAFTVQVRWAESNDHGRRFSLSAINKGVEHAIGCFPGWNLEEFAECVATNVLLETDAEYASP